MARTYVRCPICLNTLRWDTAPAVVRGADGQTRPFVPGTHNDPVRLGEEQLDAYRQCGEGDSQHLLPYSYGDFGPPIVIGVIAGGAAGKTHLLASMIGSLTEAAGLGRLGLRVNPLDFRIHTRYEQTIIRPFLKDRRILPITRAAPVEFADALRVHNSATGRSHAVAFFDVGGERLEAYQDNPFLSALNALLFVVDAGELAPSFKRSGSVVGDSVFELVLNRLGRVHGYTPGGFLALPSAVVVAKADLLRYLGEPDVDFWFDQGEEEEYDLSTLERESEAVFRLLYRRGRPYLMPATQCLRSTLHFASAAGNAPDGDRFPEQGFGPRRTLKPLLALFAGKGILRPQPDGQG